MTDATGDATLLFETDWLGSRPVYYNEVTGQASRTINDVIDFANVEFDPEGFNAYLGTGFSIFGHTMVRDVRVLPPSTRLWRDAGGNLRLEEVPLDLLSRIERPCSEAEVIDLLRARVQAAEASTEDEIVIPTSGGYDSRLLNLMVAEPRRVRSFTFGPSRRQWDSVEVIRARALAKLIGSQWEQVTIGRFHTYMDAWDDAFGPALHAHGMYQMEFCEQVRDRVAGGNLLFSGLFGDWIEGKCDTWAPPIARAGEVRNVIFTFNQKADIRASRIPWTGELADEYYETRRETLEHHRLRCVEAVRFRMGILHYLVRVAELYGFAVDTPFLDVDVATAMLTLSDERRSHRAWVADYFESRGAYFDKRLGGNPEYSLFWPVMRRQPLPPLDESLLAEVMAPDYVRWINRTVSWRGAWYEGYDRIGRRRGFRRAAGWLDKHGLHQCRLDAYFAYMTLRPIQRLLQKRDAARRGEAVGAAGHPEGTA
jgi:hypothetical protein